MSNQDCGKILVLGLNLRSSTHQNHQRFGGFPYERDGDTRRPSLGCKLRIVVSLRLLRTKCQYFKPSRSRLVLHVEKQKTPSYCVDGVDRSVMRRNQKWYRSFRGQEKVEARPDWSLWFNSNFRRVSPSLCRVFYVGLLESRRSNILLQKSRVNLRTTL